LLSAIYQNCEHLLSAIDSYQSLLVYHYAIKMPKTIKITLLIIQWAIDRKPADECYALIEDCDDDIMFNVSFERVNTHIT